MSLKESIRKALVVGSRGVMSLLGQRFERAALRILAQGALHSRPLLESVEWVQSPGGRIGYYCVGDLATWRVETLLTKEPETIEWLHGIGAGEVLWDIGANMGLYSIYAAVARKARVMAFEPSAANYLLLNRNIEQNRLSDTVTALCIAFNDVTTCGHLNMQSTEWAGAVSTFGDTIDHNGDTFVPTFRQGMLAFSIDDFIARYQPEFPQHMKIDVDGIEDKIIDGAPRTLADPRLKSLSIELDDNRPDYTQAVVANIQAGGLRFVGKRHAPMFEDTPYANIFNYHFVR